MQERYCHLMLFQVKSAVRAELNKLGMVVLLCMMTLC
jgi:DNA-binding FrmR family transcriptional regulator